MRVKPENYDPVYFTKTKARKDLSIIGMVLLYTGTIRVYLDYQQWKLHFNWWHPFTWLTIFLIGVWGFVEGVIEALVVNKGGLFGARKRDRPYAWYKSAPNKNMVLSNELVIVPVYYDDRIGKSLYTCARVFAYDMRIEIGDAILCPDCGDGQAQFIVREIIVSRVTRMSVNGNSSHWEVTIVRWDENGNRACYDLKDLL